MLRPGSLVVALAVALACVLACKPGEVVEQPATPPAIIVEPPAPSAAPVAPGLQLRVAEAELAVRLEQIDEDIVVLAQRADRPQELGQEKLGLVLTVPSCEVEASMIRELSVAPLRVDLNFECPEQLDDQGRPELAINPVSDQTSCELSFEAGAAPQIVVTCDSSWTGGAHPDAGTAKLRFWADDFEPVGLCSLEPLFDSAAGLRERLADAIEARGCDPEHAQCEQLRAISQSAAELTVSLFLPRVDRGSDCDGAELGVSVELAQLPEAIQTQLRGHLSDAVSLLGQVDGPAGVKPTQSLSGCR